jgi:uncharacterized membrane-anchored protein YitT (DUF2179 family)
MNEKLYEWLKQSFFLSLGSAISAFAVKALLIPQGFLSTGLTGAALIIYYKYPVAPVGMLYLMINIPVFIVGWRFIGIRFVIFSFWGMLIYSLMLQLITFQLELSDPMLGVIVSGGISGIGIAIILRSYGSTGGSEILSVIIHKLFSVSVGAGTAIINGIVLTASAFLFPIDKILYALVYTVVTTLAINNFFYGLSKRKAALIISDEWQEIVKDLTGLCNVGVTKIKGRGGYRGNEKTILYSVIRRKDIGVVKKIVLQKDPGAFIALMTAEDVTGLRIGNQPHW